MPDISTGDRDSQAPARRRGSEWIGIQRCLTILQRLQQGPASGAELIEAVIAAIGPDAYSGELSAVRAAFKRDRANLRKRLGVSFHYDPIEDVYQLEDGGPYSYLQLTDEQLQALNLLSETFAGEVGERADILHLLDTLISRMSPDTKRRLEASPLAVDLDVFQPMDAAPISERVWTIIQRAIRQHRKLAFHYLSPQQSDQLPRYHEAAPYRIRFRRGHWYLYAYDLYWRNPHGQEWRDAGYRHFRLSNFKDDERLAVLPTVLASAQRKPPRYRVHYRLLPSLGRGAISRHFDEVQVTRLADGSAEVQAYTEDEWEAVRILLGYGENCIVLGGEEVLRLMERRVRGMAINYGYYPGDEA